MKFTLFIWRQRNRGDRGRFVKYELNDADPGMSFLEMLDFLNQRLIERGEEPVAFEHDCREGICGCCGMVVNGFPHGPEKGTTVCQLYLRHFQEGAHIHIEPWRSRVFPVIKDLVVDRSVLDRMMRAGGFISVPTGSAPEANTVPVPKEAAEVAMDAAACIGCGACVAACPNGAAALFVSARLGHLGLLPQGQPERERRAKAMIRRMDREGFGACGNHRECEAVCPKRISIRFIARANRDFLKAFFVHPGKA